MYKPTISDIVEGSYKEGFDLNWEISGFHILIERSSIRGIWTNIFNAIECNIDRDIKKYYPTFKVKWI